MTFPSSETRPLTVSVVSCAFNEAKNLPSFLDAVLASRLQDLALGQIIVSTAGSTDSTDEVIAQYHKADGRVTQVSGRTRLGKVAALRDGLSAATGELLVVINADTVPSREMIQRLCEELIRSGCDLVCTKPVPVGRPHSIVERMGFTLWRLHHLLSELSPKAAQAYALKRSVLPLFELAREDDDVTLALLTLEGKINARYRPDAVVWCNVPDSVADFVAQRIRINQQIVATRRSTRLLPRTWDIRAVAKIATAEVKNAPFRDLADLAAFAIVEQILRSWAVLCSQLGAAKNVAWPMIESTKHAIISPETDPKRQ